MTIDRIKIREINFTHPVPKKKNTREYFKQTSRRYVQIAMKIYDNLSGA